MTHVGRPARKLATRISPVAAVLACSIIWFAGCGDVVAQPIGASAPSDDAGGRGDSASGPDAPPFDGNPLQDASAFCEGHGPIPLGGGSQRCTGDLSHLFRFAVCACQSLDTSGHIKTDSFDSSGEAGAGGSDTASIAANGEISLNANPVTIGGSIYAGGQSLAAGTPAVTLRGGGTILHDVQAAGGVNVGGLYQVDGDVDTTGNVVLDPGASLNVLGKVTLPPGDSAAGVNASGGVQNGAVSVPPPCDCSNPIDVASLVAAHQSDNDDASIHLATTALDDPSAAVALPCGRYYVDGIQGGVVQLDITGRVALFVQGDVSVNTSFAVNLTPDAELDLFVAGNVSIMLSGADAGNATIGDANAASRVRLYVGGASLQLSAAATVGVNVYAPNAVVALASSLEMWGALLAKSYQFSGDFTIHYDTSVLTTNGCAPSGGSCSTCDDCAGATPACKGGTCVPCTTSADCCAPLLCSAGRCVLGTQ